MTVIEMIGAEPIAGPATGSPRIASGQPVHRSASAPPAAVLGVRVADMRSIATGGAIAGFLIENLRIKRALFPTIAKFSISSRFPRYRIS
jgi:hypothetical protein